MAKQSPMQQMKARFGSKEELVKQLVDRLHRRPDEDVKTFAKRLQKVSSQKLLHLFEVTETVYKQFGAKADLVEAVLKLERPTAKSEDVPFKNSLQKMTHARLLDRFRGLKQRASKVKTA